jgi:hypothetical protein
MTPLPQPQPTPRNWRPATFRGPDDSRGVLANSWELIDPSNQRVARIHLEQDGPEAGQWRWFVLVHPHGAPLGETGLCRSESKAREICERKVPDWTIARLPHGRRRPLW